MLDRIEALFRLVERLLDLLIAALVLALVAIVSSQLVDRHVVTLPMAAPDQYARIFLVWLTFLGFSIAIRNGTNIRVDLIDARLPRVLRRALEVAFDGLMLVLIVLFAWYGWPLYVVGLDQERLGTIFSEAWPTAALLVSAVFMALFLAMRIALALSGRSVPRAEHAE